MKPMLQASWKAAIVILLASQGFAQMEKREDERYRLAKFINAHPKVGEKAPEMEIRTLKGKPVKLSSYQGKTLVLIKGSFT